MQTTKINHEPEDNLEREILAVLYDSGESLTTSQIKDRLGLDGTNAITYRARERLEPRGIVSIGVGESTHPTAIAPLKITLTAEGEQWVESINLDSYDAETVIERIEHLERQVEQQQALINDLLTATGVRQEQDLPNVVSLRAGYTSIPDAFAEVSNGDVNVNEFVGKWASDAARDITDDLGE